jgi:hypothetical protein
MQIITWVVVVIILIAVVPERWRTVVPAVIK